jgi:hypothetical protein
MTAKPSGSIAAKPSGSIAAKPSGSIGPASADLPTRRDVSKLFGAPTDQVGSVNDPRTHDENGVLWNEKWIYRDGLEITRVVLWHRYDLLGVFRIRSDGSAEAEPMPNA